MKVNEDSYKAAYQMSVLNDFLDFMKEKVASSLALFDKTRDKTPLFCSFEENLKNPLAGVSNLGKNAKEMAEKLVRDEMNNHLMSHKEELNFAYLLNQNHTLIYVINTKNKEIQNHLEDLNYEYFISNLQNLVPVEFHFVHDGFKVNDGLNQVV